MNKHVLTVTAVMGVVLSVAAMVQGCGPAPSVNSGAQASNLSPQAVNRQQEGDAVLLARIQKLEKQLQEQADTLTNVRADHTALISDLSDTKTRQGERMEKQLKEQGDTLKSLRDDYAALVSDSSHIKETQGKLREDIAKGVVTKSVTIVNDEGIAGTCLEWGTVRSAALRLDNYEDDALFGGPSEMKLAGGSSWFMLRPFKGKPGGMYLLDPESGKRLAELDENDFKFKEKSLPGMLKQLKCETTQIKLTRNTPPQDVFWAPWQAGNRQIVGAWIVPRGFHNINTDANPVWAFGADRLRGYWDLCVDEERKKVGLKYHSRSFQNELRENEAITLEIVILFRES